MNVSVSTAAGICIDRASLLRISPSEFAALKREQTTPPQAGEIPGDSLINGGKPGCRSQAALRPPARGTRPRDARVGGSRYLSVPRPTLLPSGSNTGSPHLVRAPQEPIVQELEQFYGRLLAVLRHPVVRNGRWQLLECTSAWEGNRTSDCFLAFARQNPDGERLLVTVNYAPNQSQCYLRLPFTDLGNRQWRLEDLIGKAAYDRQGDDLQTRGLYLDVPPWDASIFSLTKQTARQRDDRLGTKGNHGSEQQRIHGQKGGNAPDAPSPVPTDLQSARHTRRVWAYAVERAWVLVRWRDSALVRSSALLVRSAFQCEIGKALKVKSSSPSSSKLALTSLQRSFRLGTNSSRACSTAARGRLPSRVAGRRAAVNLRHRAGPVILAVVAGSTPPPRRASQLSPAAPSRFRRHRRITGCRSRPWT